MSIFSMQIFIALILLLFYLHTLKLCARTIFALFIFITHFSGYILISLACHFDNGCLYKDVESIGAGISYSLVGFILYMLFSMFFGGYRNPAALSDVKKEIPVGYLYLTIVIYSFIYLSSALLYLYNVGVSLDFSGDYGSRLEENAGNGILILGMTGFLPALIACLLVTEKRAIATGVMLAAVLLGLTYFFIVGGSRNVLAAGTLAALYVIYKKKLFKKQTIFLFVITLIALVNGLVFVRYGVDVKNLISEQGVKVLYYTADSFSPLHYQVMALEAIDKGEHTPQGLGLFFNQFLGMVPRGIWPEKPLVLMNSSYYFTKEILELEGNLNMASTLLSSSMVMFGKSFFFLAYIFAALIMAMLDKLMISKKLPNILLAIVVLPFSFFMARENIELYLFIILKFAIVIYIGWFLSWAIYSILKPIAMESKNQR